MRKLKLARPSWGLLVALVWMWTAPVLTALDKTPTGVAEATVGALAPSDELIENLPDSALRALLREVLDRHPDVARAAAKARAVAQRAPQVRSLDDPVAALNLFLLPPETRVGPQRFSVAISQKLPWFGKLALREQAALYQAAAARATVEVERLRVLTETRRSLAELAFLDLHQSLTEEEKVHLIHHEEAARSRYTVGMGLQQEILKIQAAITRREERLLVIETRRQTLFAAVNASRARPADEPIAVPRLPEPQELALDLDALRRLAAERKPELERAAAEIAMHRTVVELAEKNDRPDFQLGLGYTFVDRRQDATGRANPPPDDGDDVLMLSAAIHLPIRRVRLAAALEEAHELRRVAEADEQREQTAIERRLGETFARLPLLYQQWTLLDKVLLAQAEEALSSAVGAYTTGNLGALDLLDAEHVLFEIRTSAARTRAEYAATIAALEAAIASPLGERDPGAEYE